MGLDPDLSAEPWSSAPGFAASGERSPDEADARAVVASAVVETAARLIASAGPACVAVKPQLARFEALGAPGWAALEQVVRTARDAGLLVIADGKRGDIPLSAGPYADAIIGSTPTPLGHLEGLGADALTVNPLMGRDSIEPMIERASQAGAGVFVLVRTSNPGASDLLDLSVDGVPIHERLAGIVDQLGHGLIGSSGLSGLGAVVGATQPRFIEPLRELMPRAIFLLPGVGAQGGDPGAIGAAFAPGRAAAVITASRSITGAGDPAAAAEALRAEVWAVAQSAASS